MVNEFKNAAGVTFPQGFKAAGVKAGIKKSGNLDVAVIYTEKEAVVAGTFTQNAVAAAPVFASKAVVATGTAHAIVANAGCANACTGEQGEKDAKATQEIAAKALGCVTISPDNVALHSLPGDFLDVVVLFHDGKEITEAPGDFMAALLKAAPLSSRPPETPAT